MPNELKVPRISVGGLPLAVIDRRDSARLMVATAVARRGSGEPPPILTSANGQVISMRARSRAARAVPGGRSGARRRYADGVRVAPEVEHAAAGAGGDDGSVSRRGAARRIVRSDVLPPRCHARSDRRGGAERAARLSAP